MGLIETGVRVVTKKGLGPRILRALPAISLLCSLVGLLWLGVFPLDGQFRHTYVSENALLPHQASTYFRESEWHILRGFRNEIRGFKDLPEPERNQALTRLFDQIGLKSTVHEWRNCTSGQSCENVYSILHAPRGSHNEAIVIAAPWLNSEGKFNDGGVTLLISLARFLRKWSIWHKNLIFIVPSDPHVALRSWVGAYHSSLKYTAGSVEGALVIDYPDDAEFFDHIEVAYDGLNGQLPNLDLINTAVRVAESEGVRSEILGMGLRYFEYGQRLRTLLKGMGQQVVAGLRPGAGCEMFSGWRIDAITLRARGSPGPHDITTFGRLIESTVRSVNNLLEHFHQSFFFYLLLGPGYFVSIGTYLPAALLVASSYSIMAIHTLLTAKLNFTLRDALIAICTMVSAVSVTSLISALILDSAGNIVATAALLAGAMISFLTARMFLAENIKRLLFGFSLIAYGLSLTVLAMMNFSLAMALGIVSIPLAWVRHDQVTGRIFSVVACPLVGLYGVAWYIALSPSELMQSLIIAHKQLDVWLWNIVMRMWLPMWLVGLAAAY